jgi:uncharacterized membrane protein (UPF0136 family)
MALIFKERSRMSARTKINGIVFGGVLLFSALLGAMTHSWLVFAIVSIVASALLMHAGELRFRPNDAIMPRRAGRKGRP